MLSNYDLTHVFLLFSFTEHSTEIQQALVMLFYSLYDQETASQTQSPAQTVNETDENHTEKQIV